MNQQELILLLKRIQLCAAEAISKSITTQLPLNGFLESIQREADRLDPFIHYYQEEFNISNCNPTTT
jgi:hypothetical protein